MSNEIRVEVEVSHSGTVRIVGYVGGRDVMSISNYIFGKWHVGSSSCLPSDPIVAEAYVKCCVEVFAEMHRRQAA